MEFDGLCAHVQVHGDLFVGAAVGHGGCDFAFSVGQSDDPLDTVVPPATAGQQL